jgi:DNA-binding transcriptional MerR regulator/predicted transcriptional regulator YdeE
MLKIGDFSALAHVSITTLRYYDQAGLLTPARIDDQTGYRYYAAHQLTRLHRILALRDFGLSLEQIADMLRAGVTAEEMRGMLKLQQAEQERRVREEGDRLSRLNSRIRLIEKENDMSYDVVIKNLSRLKIASVREVVPTYPAIGALYPKVAERMGPKMAQAGISVAIWHDKEHKDSDHDAEAGFLLRGDVGRVEGVDIHDLPETTAACTVHSGAYQRLSEAYDALLKWVSENGYEVAGPIREMYVHMTKPVRQDDESYVTEIQVPVRKAA